VVLVRFPTRLVLAGSVLGVFAASGGTALTMGAHTPVTDAAVAVPDFAAPAGAPTGNPPPVSVGPPVTGRQIAALAAGPALDRANAIVAEQAKAAEDAKRAEAEQAAAQQAPAPVTRFDNSDMQRLRERLHTACASGELSGPICAGS
jgi:hypothetical protein